MSTEASYQALQHTSAFASAEGTFGELYAHLSLDLLHAIGTFLSASDLLRSASVSKEFLHRLVGRAEQAEGTNFHTRRKNLIQELYIALKKEIAKSEERIGPILRRCAIPQPSSYQSIVYGFFEPMLSLAVEEVLPVREVIAQMREIIYGLEAQRVHRSDPSLDAFKHLLLAQLWKACPLREEPSVGGKVLAFPREALLSHWMTRQHVKTLSTSRWTAEEVHAMHLEETEAALEEKRVWTVEEVHGLAPFQLRGVTVYNYMLEQVRDAQFTQSHLVVLEDDYLSFELYAENLESFSELDVLGHLLRVRREDVPMDQIALATWREAATRILGRNEYQGPHRGGSHLCIAAYHSAYLFTAILNVCQFSPEELVAVLQRPQKLQNDWRCGPHPPFFTLVDRGLDVSQQGNDWRRIDTLIDLQKRLSLKDWEHLLMTPILFRPAAPWKPECEDWRSPLEHAVIGSCPHLLEYLLRNFEPAQQKVLIETLIKRRCKIRIPHNQSLHPAAAMVGFLRLLRADMAYSGEDVTRQEREEAVLRLILPFFMMPDAAKKAVECALYTLLATPIAPATVKYALSTLLTTPIPLSQAEAEAVSVAVATAIVEVATLAEAQALCILVTLPLALPPERGENAIATTGSTEEKNAVEVNARTGVRSPPSSLRAGLIAEWGRRAPGQLCTDAAVRMDDVRPSFSNEETSAPPPKRQKLTEEGENTSTEMAFHR